MLAGNSRFGDSQNLIFFQKQSDVNWRRILTTFLDLSFVLFLTLMYILNKKEQTNQSKSSIHSSFNHVFITISMIFLINLIELVAIYNKLTFAEEFSHEYFSFVWQNIIKLKCMCLCPTLNLLQIICHAKMQHVMVSKKNKTTELICRYSAKKHTYW